MFKKFDLSNTFDIINNIRSIEINLTFNKIYNVLICFVININVDPIIYLYRKKVLQIMITNINKKKQYY